MQKKKNKKGRKEELYLYKKNLKLKQLLQEKID